jgi:hypothetical protein
MLSRVFVRWSLAAAALVTAIPVTTSHAQRPRELSVDVLVYGGTAAGVIAAYTAKRYGKSVLLVEPGRHLGGMTSGGLGMTDIGNKYAVTGLGLDFYRRVGRYYGRFEAWLFEPHVAERVLHQYIDEADVEVMYLRRVTSVEKRGAELRRITLEYAGRGAGLPDVNVTAKEFIDATYEGDLMAKARVAYVVGREGNSMYGETVDGVQVRSEHQFPDGVDPYRVRGDAKSGLLPEISAASVAPNGTGDKKVQAYNFRMAMCQGDKRVPIARPTRYDSARYELLLRLIEKTPTYRLNQRFKIDALINGKYDWNNQGAFSTDFIGHSWTYPEADYATRARIVREHEDYQKGLLYFVGNDPRVPAALRAEMQSWGLCRDEFLDTGGWPHQIYVREARRMVGEYVMTEHNARGTTTVSDGVGMAAYTMDSHNAQRVVINGMVKNEGDVQVGGFPPYPISYRSIVPRSAQATNLIVPVALSASHIAYGSIRMEPVFMVLAQAAAVAASRAIDGGVPVQRVDIAALQRELVANPRADGSAPELLVDDADAQHVTITGAWTRETTPGRFGPSALRAPATAPGSVRFTPHVAHAGRYRVYLYWPRPKGLATSAPVRLRHATGLDSLTLDLTATGENAQGVAAWTFIGERTFAVGDAGWVEIGAEGANGIVMADAALFVPVADAER